MSSLLNESDLRHENAVVWLENPDDLDYVRQALDKTARRRGKPRYERDGRMVGYTELDAHAEADPDSGLQLRRVFFLLPHDRDANPEGPISKAPPAKPSTPAPSNPNAWVTRLPAPSADPAQ